MDSYERHPLSACWPAIEPDEVIDLTEDIREKGVQQPIIMHDGKVLDGWHRYCAALEAGVPVVVEEYVGDDPAGYVISVNARRRHLSKGEIAKAIVRCREWRPHGDQSSASSAKVHTAKEMAKEGNVSVRTIADAKRDVREERGEAPPKKSKPAAKKKTKTKAKGKDPVERAAQEALADAINERDDARAAANHLRDQLAVADGADPAIGEQTINGLREDIKILRGQLNDWQTKCRDLRAERNNLQRENRNLTKENANLQARILELEELT